MVSRCSFRKLNGIQSAKLVLLLLLLSLLSACAATGPKYTQIHSTFPAIKPDFGRVFFYRSGTMMGAAIQPDILLNGQKVGQSVPGGFFYVDRDPGNYMVSCSTETTRQVVFTLEPGQTRYVRTRVGIGLLVGRVYPELVDPGEATKEIEDNSYIGGK